jgi:hypothetical protein
LRATVLDCITVILLCVLGHEMLSKRIIFTFASNMAGRHGAGSALEALNKWGAQYGLGYGLHGNSYAIPTKDANLKRLALPIIKLHVKTFLTFARDNPKWEFQVVKIGCGLAGYKEEQIKPFFAGAPENCLLPEGWR